MPRRTSRDSTRIPRIEKGQRITASYLNRIGTVINERVLNAPKDLDGGVEQGAGVGPSALT